MTGRKWNRGGSRDGLDPTVRDHFVYWAYDVDRRLLYVGCTKQPDKRWAAHRHSSAWVKYADHFRMVGPHTYATARALEAEAIERDQPFFNETRARWRQRHAANRVTTAKWEEMAVDGAVDSYAYTEWLWANGYFRTAEDEYLEAIGAPPLPSRLERVSS